MNWEKLVEALEGQYRLAYLGAEANAKTSLDTYRANQEQLRDSALANTRDTFDGRMANAQNQYDNTIRRELLTQLRAQIDAELN